MAESAWDQHMKMDKKPPVKAPTPPLSPEVLGTGLAEKAGQAMKNRKSQMDKAITDAGG